MPYELPNSAKDITVWELATDMLAPTVSEVRENYISKQEKKYKIPEFEEPVVVEDEFEEDDDEWLFDPPPPGNDDMELGDPMHC